MSVTFTNCVFNRLFNSPLDIPSLGGWYDSSDSSTIHISSGVSVEQFDDKSGNDRHLTMPTFIYQPSYSGTINGLNALRFDTNDRIDLNLFPDVIGASTIFVVYKPSTIIKAVNDTLFTTESSPATNNSFNFKYFSNDANSPLFWDARDNSGVTQDSQLEVASDTSVHCVAARMDGINKVKTYYDGSVVDDLTIANGFLCRYRRFKIGSSRDNTKFFDGDIVEVIIYFRALQDNEIAEVHEYLQRWGW